jgi:UDP:flavonoid glycosyltransferase YjiC (YdhE family)
MAPAAAESMRRWGTEAVVADTLTVAGWFGADLLGVPRVELIPHPLQDASPSLPPPGSGLPSPRTAVGRRQYAWLYRLGERSREWGRSAARDARVSLGLPPEGPPALRLVATLPALEPPRPDWPERTVVCGPLEWDPAVGDLSAPPGSGPLVFLADTSATGRPQTLLEVAARGLAGSGVRVAATRLSPWAGRDLPPNVVVGPGRQAPLLDRASAVVCAGGHGMVAKALARGLPLVVVPGPGDQKENAARVARAGAGIALPPRRLTPQRLASAVARVLRDPSYSVAARRMAATADGLGPEYAARLVEDALVDDSRRD